MPDQDETSSRSPGCQVCRTAGPTPMSSVTDRLGEARKRSRAVRRGCSQGRPLLQGYEGELPMVPRRSIAIHSESKRLFPANETTACWLVGGTNRTLFD
jgi:hypothetical protein